jgi:acetyl-CoA carboxylase carboxyltransferase component
MPCVESIRPRLIFAWPSAELAVMGGTQAAKVLAQIEASSLKKEKWRREVDETTKKLLFPKIKPDTTNRFLLTMLLQIVDRCDYRSSEHENLDIYGY